MGKKAKKKTNQQKKNANRKRNNNNRKPKNGDESDGNEVISPSVSQDEEVVVDEAVPSDTAAKTDSVESDGQEVTSLSVSQGDEVVEVDEAVPSDTATDTDSAAEGEGKNEVSPPVNETETEPELQEEAKIPEGLEASLSLLTEKQQKLALALCSPEANQKHLFAHWTAPSEIKSPSSDAVDKKKLILMEQLESLDDSYPTGILGYISNAKDLLDKSKRGVNPLEGWKPSVPIGQSFEIGTDKFDATEKLGLKEVGTCGFILAAGGLGERLGYGDIKPGLPTELATETSYLQFYIETILAYQKKYAAPGQKLPLCIMVSGDTNEGTVDLLAKNDNFGMEKDQITLVQQGQGVPALENNDARIALDGMDRYKVQTKPHGHGDIHALLYSHEVAKNWLENGIKWAVFFQDTNGLAFHTLPLSLGVSSELGLVMNSIAVPRKGKQAVGGIAKLTNSEGEERTINVEYNQLDPLLRASGFPDGDTNDEKTGFSPFPGNINQLVFSLEPYVNAISRTKGAMPEFVNPKYKDAAKTVFKKPTRLECMMQDFPTILEGADAKNVGFTSISADLCFSPVKNATVDGVVLQGKGTQTGTAASGESDQYAAVAKIMRSIGCQVEESSPATYCGITVVPGPAIVLKPDFAACPAEYKEKFPNSSAVKISGRSSLVVKGSGVVIKSLELDGALVIECEDGASGVIENLVVKNKGWENVEDESNENKVISMRGYRLDRKETRKIVFKKDGSIEGDYPQPAIASTIVSEEPSVISSSEPEAGTSKPQAESKAEPTTAEANEPNTVHANPTQSKAAPAKSPTKEASPMDLPVHIEDDEVDQKCACCIS